MLLVTHKIDSIGPRVITDPKIFCEPLKFPGFNNSDTYSLMGMEQHSSSYSPPIYCFYCLTDLMGVGLLTV